MNETGVKKLLSAATGTNETYYLGRFLQYQEHGLPYVSWNLAGFLFGLFWFAYRKIWVVVIPMLSLLLVSEFASSGELKDNLRIAVVLLGAVAGGFFGNQLYFLWVRILIWQGNHNGKTGDELVEYVRREGGTISNEKVIRYFER